MAQQTTLEWFIEKTTESGHLWFTDKPNDVIELCKIIEQAKQIEKEQIMISFYEGMKMYPFDPNMGRAEMYYNQKYKDESNS